MQKDVIYRQDDFEKQIHEMFDHIWDCEIDHPVFQDTVGDLMRAVIQCHKGLPPTRPTLYGYNIAHLEMIARVLQKEGLPPERVVEALTDIGRIVAIVSDEFEETLRKAVEQCTI